MRTHFPRGNGLFVRWNARSPWPWSGTWNRCSQPSHPTFTVTTRDQRSEGSGVKVARLSHSPGSMLKPSTRAQNWIRHGVRQAPGGALLQLDRRVAAVIRAVDGLAPGQAGEPRHVGALAAVGVAALDLVTRQRALRRDVEAGEVRVALEARPEDRLELHGSSRGMPRVRSTRRR